MLLFMTSMLAKKMITKFTSNFCEQNLICSIWHTNWIQWLIYSHRLRFTQQQQNNLSDLLANSNRLKIKMKFNSKCFLAFKIYSVDNLKCCDNLTFVENMHLRLMKTVDIKNRPLFPIIFNVKSQNEMGRNVLDFYSSNNNIVQMSTNVIYVIERALPTAERIHSIFWFYFFFQWVESVSNEPTDWSIEREGEKKKMAWMEDGVMSVKIDTHSHTFLIFCFLLSKNYF